VQFFQTRRLQARLRKWIPVLALILLCGCQVWNIEKGIKKVGRDIEEAEGLGMEEAALYHLNVAKSLVEAARKQYEEADFEAAAQFLDQSERQLARAKTLHALQASARPPDGI
jgi:hypothetical protein